MHLPAPEYIGNSANAVFSDVASCIYMLDKSAKVVVFSIVVVLAYLMLSGNGMLDLIFLIATVAFFALSLAYVQGCQRL